MASEVFRARERSVNPLNSVASKRRTGAIAVDNVIGKNILLQQSGEMGEDNYHSLSVKLIGGSGNVPYTFKITEYDGMKINKSNVKVKDKKGAQNILDMLKSEYKEMNY